MRKEKFSAVYIWHSVSSKSNEFDHLLRDTQTQIFLIEEADINSGFTNENRRDYITRTTPTKATTKNIPSHFKKKPPIVSHNATLLHKTTQYDPVNFQRVPNRIFERLKNEVSRVGTVPKSIVCTMKIRNTTLI